MRILIVKHGALGDVVRTSYFARPLREKYGKGLELFWITAPESKIILQCNPYIDRLITSFDDIKDDEFDVIYSLDDEISIVSSVANLKAKKITGSFLDGNVLTYSSDASEWFDMGLLSKLGKERADELKRINRCGHAEIFQGIFEVTNVRPEFYLSEYGKLESEKLHLDDLPLIGINPYAGGRWPSKEIHDNELLKLIFAIAEGHVFKKQVKIVLFGSGTDRIRNLKILDRISNPSIREKVIVADTDSSIMKFAGYISRLQLMISSDSLAMHLAIAQGIYTIAFFSPTSASEIDDFGICQKITSTAKDYCSYHRMCDNSTITAERIISKIISFQYF